MYRRQGIPSEECAAGRLRRFLFARRTAVLFFDDSEEENDELDLTKPHREGERKSKRPRSDRQRDISSYMLDSSQIEFSDDEVL